MKKIVFIFVGVFLTVGVSTETLAERQIVFLSDREGYLEEFQDRRGHVVASNYYDARGILRSHKVFELITGRVEEGSYDLHGRLIRKTFKEPNGLPLFTEKYDRFERLWERIDFGSLGIAEKKRIFEYDKNDNLLVVRLIRPSNTRTIEEIRYRYREDGTADAMDHYNFGSDQGVPVREHLGTAFFDETGKHIIHAVGEDEDFGEVARRLRFRRQYRIDPNMFVHVDENDLLWLIEHFEDGGTDVRVESAFGRVISLESYDRGGCPHGEKCMRGRFEPLRSPSAVF